MSTAPSDLVFSGIQPSGAQVHVGNYLGAMKKFVTLSERYPTMVCIVDLHALTSVENPADLRSHTLSLAAAYLAIGLDPSKVIIFRQSDVPEHCELAWYLACQCGAGLLERALVYKDAREKGKVINSGVVFYPILMAADVLIYRANKVPVGADQKQHLEMMREMAGRFNSVYGEVLVVPEPLIDEGSGVIPGLDGRKMSKSYNNYIGLFEDPKPLRKKVMSIVTDSKSVEEAKDPTTCNVFQLYQHFASPEAVANLAERYRAGGMGYGYAKEQLFEAMNTQLTPMREHYHSLMERPDELIDVLREGAKRARAIACETMLMVRDAQGLGALL